MKTFIVIFLFSQFIFGCSDNPELEIGADPNARTISCDSSSVKIIRVEEDATNKEKIAVSDLGYSFLFKFFVVNDRLLQNDTIDATGYEVGVDFNLFIERARKLVMVRANSYVSKYGPIQDFEVLDPRLFLTNGDYVLSASVGCPNETSLILDDEFSLKYVYTFNRMIILKRDKENRIESTLDFTHGKKPNEFQRFHIDRYVSSPYRWKIKKPETNLGNHNRFIIDEKSDPVFRIYLDQTIAFNIGENNYQIFDLINSPFFYHRTRSIGPADPGCISCKNTNDMRRAIAFSFLDDQLEKEKTIDPESLKFKEVNLLNKEESFQSKLDL